MELLERASQLQLLNSALAQAKAGQGCIALVYGEAGIGKTSLVEHFVNENKKSWRILSGACDSLFTPRPLGPLHDIAIQTGGRLSALLDSESNRQAIFSACLNELKNQNSILVTEDVHWADEATLDLLKYLGRRIRQTTSLMILTYRDDEIGMDHPLRFLLGDLASSQALHRIPVSSLSKDAVHELAKNKKIDPVALHHMTNGNPFFVTEVLAGESGIPETVRDAVLARAARLSLSARAVLEAAAVIGLRVEPWLLSEITGAKVEECISKGMLQPQGDYYVFRHELARQTILAAISPQRRIALHRMTLNALKESPETRNDLARLANHAEGTKDASAVLEYAPAAAKQASAASSHREAIVLYALALRFADTLPPTELAQMLEAYAFELKHIDKLGREVIAVYKKAIEQWRAIGDRLKEGKNLAELAGDLITFGQEAEAVQSSRTATVLLETLPTSIELAMAYRAQCFVRWSLGDYTEAASWGEKAVALAERFDDAEVLASACNYLGCCATMVIGYGRGRALLERSLAIAREANLEFYIASALANLVRMSSETYQFAYADRYMAEGIPYAVEHDDDYHALEMLSYQAITRLYQGHWADVAEPAAKALHGLGANIVALINVPFALGRLRVRQGTSNAIPALDEALILSKQENAIQHLGSVRAARAEAAWLTSDYDRAIEEARAVYEVAVSKGDPWVTGELTFWRWRAGDNISPPSWIAKPFALQIAGDWRGAADEWEQRGCPYEQAMALMDGDEAAQFTALEIFEHLGARPITEKLKQKMRAEGVRGIPRGPRPATRENPFGLTSREMEVLACLVNGLSNNAIARKLSISSRTTEHHIAAILDKFGVESRSEAIVLALQHHLLGTE